MKLYFHSLALLCCNLASFCAAQQDTPSCCLPASDNPNVVQATIPSAVKDAAVPNNMVLLKGGTFLMGTNDGQKAEGPVHEVTVSAFYMDKNDVTIADFREFVQATGYKTNGEARGRADVFDTQSGKWGEVSGANWQFPEGPDKPALLFPMSRWCKSPPPMLKPMRRGRKSGCPPKPNGSMRREAGSRRKSTGGAMKPSPKARGLRTRGKAISP